MSGFDDDQMEFAARYDQMSDGELLELAAQPWAMSDAAWDALAKDPVNLRWQAQMAQYFEPVPDLKPGERFAMMKEVFHMD